MPSCYAVGAKKALIYRAYRTQNRGSKEKIPYEYADKEYQIVVPEKVDDILYEAN